MIRAGRAGDAPAIAAFWNPLIRDTVVTFSPLERSEDDIIAMIDGRETFLVAEEGGDVLGFATYSQFRGGPGYAFAQEHTIILSPAARGRGVGRALLQALEQAARDKGHHVMIAGISGGNPEGLAFHAALGYAEVARMPELGRKFGQWHDLVFMQKLL
ncbi:GNAT family N-acetyltransferase [Pararhodobacter sp. CCB-MM2]|uniref:GNAT family N-acetyltransferase n=1 Tax=Pararhodobacter sp. CCB-MM2 TaxID=1786003 RepID=UPI0008326E06|nr:GNAT family N-acetyltransferase [Pararhodobacter sp. CCB-MM2]